MALLIDIDRCFWTDELNGSCEAKAVFWRYAPGRVIALCARHDNMLNGCQVIGNEITKEEAEIFLVQES